MNINIFEIIIKFGALILAMTVHECAHGWTAYKLGDNTAKYSGRLTLNPLAHIDLFWTILLPLFLFISTNGQFVFGAAKPVPINFWALKNPKRDIVWIGLSGPFANFIFAFLLGLLMKFVFLPNALALFIGYLIVVNVYLGVFNLIPIPPLDGSRVVTGFLPPDLSEKYNSIEPYGFVIIAVLISMGAFNILMGPLLSLIFKLLGVLY